jgi:hypothetical protein
MYGGLDFGYEHCKRLVLLNINILSRVPRASH